MTGDFVAADLVTGAPALHLGHDISRGSLASTLVRELQ
jgi:hypothetical protein